MNLRNLYDLALYPSDKGHAHNYINAYYNIEFDNKKYEPIKLLEIGVESGASLDLWSHFFEKATIYGIDINTPFAFKNLKNDVIVKIANAYDIECVNSFDNDMFDYIIDDGPHTLESQLLVIEYYYDKLKLNGKLIIEDIQSDSDLQSLVNKCIEKEYTYKVFDLRPDKGRYDDIILEITKK